MKKALTPIPYYKTEIMGGFWRDRQELNRKVTVRAVYDRFKETGRIGAFKFSWKEGEDQKPHFYWDSDVAKWIEGVAYITRLKREPQLEALADEIIEDIVKNQGEDGETLYVHQYVNARTTVSQGERNVKVTMKTDFPTSGHVEIHAEGGALSLAVRIPSWCGNYTGKTVDGYAYMTVSDGEYAVFDFDMTPRIVQARPEVLFCAGKGAVMRGPVVYCSESVDNGDYLRNIRLDPTSPICVMDDKEYGIPTLVAKGYRTAVSDKPSLYSDGILPQKAVDVKLIPYYAFANRGISEMLIWHHIKM